MVVGVGEFGLGDFCVGVGEFGLGDFCVGVGEFGLGDFCVGVGEFGLGDLLRRGRGVWVGGFTAEGVGDFWLGDFCVGVGEFWLGDLLRGVGEFWLGGFLRGGRGVLVGGGGFWGLGCNWGGCFLQCRLMLGYLEMGARPAGVRYNDWRGVGLPPLAGFAPRLPVSVVMPYYRTPGAVLGRTLAALEGQSYPRDLFEVVIVDDGSEPPLELPRSPLNVRVVRQERCGVGIARARNTGVRAAAHDIILFLDSDLMAEPGWMLAHARWHHFVSDVVSVGFLAHVRADHLTEDAVRGRSGTLGELLSSDGGRAAAVNNQLYMLRTQDLTTRSDDLFRVVVGGNFGIGRGFYWEAGGHNESFVRYGLEDTEFSYRVYTRGGLFAPVREGLVWHQGRKPESDADKRRDTRVQRGKAAHLIAHPQFRGGRARRIYAAPQYGVTIEAGDCPAEQVIEVVGNVLADRVYDLAVRVEVGDDDRERLAWLRDVFDPDPRVRVTAPGGDALEEFPASPFQVRLPATVTGRDLVHRLRGRLGGRRRRRRVWMGAGRLVLRGLGRCTGRGVAGGRRGISGRRGGSRRGGWGCGVRRRRRGMGAGRGLRGCRGGGSICWSGRGMCIVCGRLGGLRGGWRVGAGGGCGRGRGAVSFDKLRMNGVGLLWAGGFCGICG